MPPIIRISYNDAHMLRHAASSQVARGNTDYGPIIARLDEEFIRAERRVHHWPAESPWLRLVQWWRRVRA